MLGCLHILSAPALERLRAHGMPLALLSNGSPEMLASAISAAGMSGVSRMC